MLAMAQSIVEKGFQQTVVADVVRIARVSRRTFYENFDDRVSCFLELCDRSTKTAWQLVDEAADPELPWREQARRAVDVYITFMRAEPALTRSFLFEVFSIGDRGAKKFREIQHRFAEQFQDLAARIRAENPELNEISYLTASAIVSGICELVMLSVEEGQTASEEDVREAALQLVFDVVSAPR
jgi:AcrR family transcriptional regulator